MCVWCMYAKLVYVWCVKIILSEILTEFVHFSDFSLGESTSGVATLSPSGTFTSFPSPDSVNTESEDVRLS